MKKIRVLIVEDSRVVRRFLEHLIRGDPRLEVAAAVESAEEALRILHRIAPDVISMDIRLPGMTGFEATRRIMADRPTPIVVVSASVEAEDLQISMNALRAGALAVVEKPVGSTHADYQALAERLCTQLAIMSQVKVVRQRWPRKHEAGRQNDRRHHRSELRTPNSELRGPFRLLGVVASTGGPQALVQVLGVAAGRFPLADRRGTTHHDEFPGRLRVLAGHGVPVPGGNRRRPRAGPSGPSLPVSGGCASPRRGKLAPLGSRRPGLPAASVGHGSVSIDGPNIGT